MKREAIMVTYLPFYFLFFILELLLFLTPSLQGYQCSTVVKSRYLATKTKLEELTMDNKDLLKKISNVMNKVSKSEKLRSEAEENTKVITERKEALENTKVITERKEALEKKLQETKKDLVAKTAELKAFVAADDEKI